MLVFFLLVLMKHITMLPNDCDSTDFLVLAVLLHYERKQDQIQKKKGDVSAAKL